MQIIIDTMQCPCRTLDDKCGISGHECYEDDICSSCPLISNGGVKLPKGHGKIVDIGKIDKDKIESNNPIISLTIGGEYIEAVSLDYLDNLPTIIEADKTGSEVEE